MKSIIHRLDDRFHAGHREMFQREGSKGPALAVGDGLTINMAKVALAEHLLAKLHAEATAIASPLMTLFVADLDSQPD